MNELPELNVLATGLEFPEGPIAMPDGSVLLVEIARGTLSRVDPETQEVSVVATPGGGPNGAAMGPDGNIYVCNNGGFDWVSRKGRIFPSLQGGNYSGGRIERIDIASGEVEVLFDACDGEPLKGPNDLVFDSTGGFWFTDHGKTRERSRDRTGVFYARADGSHIEEKLFPLEGPNGIGLSPDEKFLYVAETPTGRLWSYALSSTGVIDREQGMRGDGGSLLASIDGYFFYDSLAVDGLGRVCVATIRQGGISVVDPLAGTAYLVPMPDRLTTNICFGGEDLRTAYITLSSTGQLVSMTWPVSGAPLAFLND